MKKIIRFKAGETVNSFTTLKKQVRYPDKSNIKGFKIDARYLLNYDDNEFDLCAGEVAINTLNNDKITHDRSNCLREAKDLCDHHIQSGLGRNLFGWCVQFSGLDARLMTVHRFNGLYIGILPR